MLEYGRYSPPLLDLYGKQGKLISVNGMAPIEAVTKAMNSAIAAAPRSQ